MAERPERSIPLEEIEERIRQFISDRDWDRFHRSKDVAMALAIEASELQELYLWDRTPSKEQVEDEAADVLFFLVDLSMREGIDLVGAFRRKMEKNENRYPAQLVKGKDLKYDAYVRNSP